MKTVTVLGGSTPFTLALIYALQQEANALPPLEVVLVGRDPRALDAVGAHATSVFQSHGWSVRATQDIDASLACADIVVQQIRFGGMRGRMADEAVAAKLGLAADESLGPAALHRILQSAQELRALGERIARLAPKAWVLNLTNPLSAATTLLHEAGVERCVGVCELPKTTARAALRSAGSEPSASFKEVEWELVGLNHRSFITRLVLGGSDLLQQLLEGDSEELVGGVSLRHARELGAIPTKYFLLMLGSEPGHGAGRAQYLEELRGDLLDQLAAAPTERPAGLAGRVVDWYDESVVPLIKALLVGGGAPHVVNVRSADGLVREGLAHVDPAGVAMIEAMHPAAGAARWIKTFEIHERSVLDLLSKPSRDALRSAVAADPLIPTERESATIKALEPLLS